ncbi:MAG: indolepyruvate oxidoreductase subunit beta [Acutalibacteraceae bacterium]
MNKSILVCGVGGQGTLLASKLIAQAAMEKGWQARSAETIGMAQRGGSVVSHVRIGQQIYSPMIPYGGADVILGFEPGEAMRALPYLKQGGTVVVSLKAVQPITVSLGASQYNGADVLAWLQKKVPNLIVVDGETVCAQCGSPKVLNVALLGAAAAKSVFSISLDELKKALCARVPERFWQMNLQALQLGAQAAQ